MILDISRLIRNNDEPMSFEVTFDGEYIERDDFKLILKSPLKITGSAYYDGGLVKIKGNISALAEAQCSRCLNAFDYPLNVDFDEVFSKSEDSEDMYYYYDDEIKLDDMVIDNVILSMPLKLLCSEKCKGLCPVCGKNLNTGECGCEKGEIDPRFAALKDLFKGD